MAANISEENKDNIPLSMDGIIKILFSLSDKLTVRMINSLFGKDIPLDATVIPENVEMHRFSQTAPTVEELRADMILNINGERYHIEFDLLSHNSDKDCYPNKYAIRVKLKKRDKMVC